MYKIMIVEDESKYLEEMRSILDLSGYSVTTVDDVNRIHEIARELKPDVILMNLNISNALGFRIAYELKQAPETLNIPIVGMLDYYLYSFQNIKALDTLGVKRCIKKPCRPLDVISHIEMAAV